MTVGTAISVAPTAGYWFKVLKNYLEYYAVEHRSDLCLQLRTILNQESEDTEAL